MERSDKILLSEEIEFLEQNKQKKGKNGCTEYESTCGKYLFCPVTMEIIDKKTGSLISGNFTAKTNLFVQIAGGYENIGADKEDAPLKTIAGRYVDNKVFEGTIDSGNGSYYRGTYMINPEDTGTFLTGKLVSFIEYMNLVIEQDFEKGTVKEEKRRRVLNGSYLNLTTIQDSFFLDRNDCLYRGESRMDAEPYDGEKDIRFKNGDSFEGTWKNGRMWEGLLRKEGKTFCIHGGCLFDYILQDLKEINNQETQKPKEQPTK